MPSNAERTQFRQWLRSVGSSSLSTCPWKIGVRAFKAFLAERLAKYKLPRTVEILDELPKTAIGKIDKKLLAGTS